MGNFCRGELNPDNYPAPPRKFRRATNYSQNIDEADKDRVIQVMSYNILCDGLDTPKNHPHGSKEILDWKFRAPRII